MLARLEVTFPDDWQYIPTIYKNFVYSTGARTVNEDLGSAIPSPTLAKLGHAMGRAVDIDPEVISYAEDVRERPGLGCALEFQCRDVFEDRPKLQKGELLIAEKPASYKKSILEVEYNIRNRCTIEGHNLAVIPSFIIAMT